MIVLDLSILNQKGTPMFYSDIFANRPTFGIVGRIFISTDTAAIYRDTGTAWDLIADGTGTASNIYNSNGTLTADRTVSSGGFALTFNPATTFDTTLTAANNASSLSIFGVNRLSYAAGFSANNIGALYGGSASFGLQTFAGSATFANSNIASGGASINSIDFSSAGSTITMTQSSGIRAMTGNQVQIQFQGTNSGTISHAAIQQNLGFYRPSAATGILTITNAYSHLINDLDDYGAGFTFTNRWGIYQAGASDTNYFAASVLIGTNVNTGEKLIANGTIKVLNANILLSNNWALTGRNFANTLNLSLISRNTSDKVVIDPDGYGTIIGGGGDVILNPNGGTTRVFDALRINKNGNFFAASSTRGVLEIDGTTDAILALTTNNTTRSYFYYSSSILQLVSDTNYQIAIGGSNSIYMFSATQNIYIGTGNTPTDTGNKLRINGSLRIDGQTSGSSGGSSGQHLIIDCDGTTYKIALLNP